MHIEMFTLTRILISTLVILDPEFKKSSVALFLGEMKVYVSYYRTSLSHEYNDLIIHKIQCIFKKFYSHLLYYLFFAFLAFQRLFFLIIYYV